MNDLPARKGMLRAKAMRKGVEENARAVLDQDEYNRRYEALMERYEAARNGIADTDSKLAECAAKREKISRFLDDLKRQDGLLGEFDEKLWLATVDFVTVHSESEMTVRFKDGMEATVDAGAK